MVALSQNWTRSTQRPHSAQIIRQTPHQRKPTSSTPTRMVLRARYYDPHTAEFTSPDPLEYVDGMSLFRGYFVWNAMDPHGMLSRTRRGQNQKDDDKYEVGDDYPYKCPPKKPCDVDKLLSYSWWSGFWTQIYFDGQSPNGDGADGQLINAVAHCFAACWIHQDIPECDHYWELYEWTVDKTNTIVGGPKDLFSDLDIRNNSIGRDIADNGTNSCINSCYNADLYCTDGRGQIIKCVRPKPQPPRPKRNPDGTWIDENGTLHWGIGPKW